MEGEGISEAQRKYYESILTGGDVPVFVQFINPTKGKGLFAARSFAKDEIIFREKPFVAQQHVQNRSHGKVTSRSKMTETARTCAHCFKFLGTLQEQLQFQALIVQQGNPYSIVFSDSVQCLGGCGEVYCSEACRTEAFLKHHKLLCVGQLTDDKHPLVLFKQHAIMKNELFLLAGQAIAVIISQWEANGGDFNRAIQPFLGFVRKPWWVVRAADSDFSESELKKLLEDSNVFLKKALQPYVEEQIRQFGKGQEILYIFSMEFYSLLVGMFELNNNSIEIPSPLQLLLEDIADQGINEQNMATWISMEPLVAELLRIQDEEAEEDDEHEHTNDTEPMDGVEGGKEEDKDMEEDKSEQSVLQRAASRDFVFPPFDGFGLFTIGSVMNHSCVPNCMVKYLNDGTAQVTALTAIEKGTELLHSYIEESLPVDEREADLLSYGFKCDCPKCTSERS